MIAPSRDIELDTGPRAHELERMCVVTRTVRPVADMIRFVIGPAGEAVPDLTRKLPGRGAWVAATQDALPKRASRRGLVGCFKRGVRLPADLVARTGQLLERGALDALAMAGKAGLVATGFTRVETALAQQEVIALLHAAEAAADGVRKLDAGWRRRPERGPIVTIGILTSAQLDLALGRPNVIHAALLAGPSSDTFLARLRRLERFRSGEPSRPRKSTR